MGVLINPKDVVPLTWASSVDEVLLVISVVFAYMAGAIPNTGTFPVPKKENSDYFRGTSTSTPYDLQEVIETRNRMIVGVK